MTPSRLVGCSLVLVAVCLGSGARADVAAARKTCKLATISEIRKQSPTGKISFDGDGDVKNGSSDKPQVSGSGKVEEGGSSKPFSFRCTYDNGSGKTSNVKVAMKGGDKSGSNEWKDENQGQTTPSGGGMSGIGKHRPAPPDDQDNKVSKESKQSRKESKNDRKAVALCQDAVRREVRDRSGRADKIAFGGSPKLDGSSRVAGTVEYKDKSGKQREGSYSCHYDAEKGVAGDVKVD